MSNNHVFIDWLNDTGVSMRELAEKSKVSYATINNVIMGKTKPSFKVMESIDTLSDGRVQFEDWKNFNGAFLTNFYAHKEKEIANVETDTDNNKTLVDSHVDDIDINNQNSGV